jgi:dolichol-phosphate mannosyltransferase
MKTLVVIPTYNERENVGRIVPEVLRAADVSVLVVDDASPDGTGALADELVAANPGRVFVLHRQGKLGLGSAYLEGFRFGIDRGFEAVCEMDADGSHDPAILPALVAAAAGGVAIGSRRVPGGKVVGWGPHRHMMSWGAMSLSRWALGLATRDVTSGYRCYRRDAVEALLGLGIRSDGYAFQEETLYHCERLKFGVTEIPIVFRDRERGKSKLSPREVWPFLKTVLRLRGVGSLRRR